MCDFLSVLVSCHCSCPAAQARRTWHGQDLRLVGYSSQHKGGYQLWNEETDRVVVRGDVHSLTFYPEDDKSHTHDTNTHKQYGEEGNDTTIIYDEESGVHGRSRPAVGPSNGQSLSLSQISHADDSGSYFGSLNSSFESGSGAASDHTPPMREGNTDDTMSDSVVFQRPERRAGGGEQWMTMADFGSPSSSSTHICFHAVSGTTDCFIPGGECAC